MKLSEKILSYLKITRPVNVSITFIVVLTAIFISKKSELSIQIILLAPLAASLTAAAGNIINDVFDIGTDKYSHPHRIIVSGLISKKQAVYAYIISNTLALIISYYISFVIFTFVVVTAAILFLYSFSFKRLPLIGNVSIALLTGFAFIYGGLAAENPGAAVIPALFAFLINFIREMIKDIQDIEGDSKVGYRTFAIVYGLKKTQTLIFSLSIILIVFTIYPFVIQLYKIEYFILVMIVINPILVLCLKYLYDNELEKKLAKISGLLKLNMLIGLIAIYLG